VFYLEGDIIENIYLIIDKYIRRIKTKKDYFKQQIPD